MPPQPSFASVVDGAPALPTKARFETLSQSCDAGPNAACSWFRVHWVEPNPADVTIRVYGLTACLHTPTPAGIAECLLNGDTIPRASLILLGTAPAAAGAMSFQLDVGETQAIGWLPGYGPAVYAVIIQAVNANGGSLFAFAEVRSICPDCTL